ncbi:hypothetical protein [Marinomonas rhodophyticola]|uniref:Dihydroxy-acid dehydratase n=1 Tax=Marinomonas rhodophyticola TaxID=2992803 RepID=A0ABT3KK01_9GAMM|nr:hypothetical protein [Marinomonas sp. KJ51-3]MCW4630739.1 hypothetical protein [Marinomonas sp. KJ51-3]
MAKRIEDLRSQRWFAPDNMRAFAHRQRTQQTGYKRSDFMNRPVIGIINTWSDISTCHTHLRERVPVCQRRHHSRWRLSIGNASYVTWRSDGEANHHDVPKFPCDGNRRTAS